MQNVSKAFAAFAIASSLQIHKSLYEPTLALNTLN